MTGECPLCGRTARLTDHHLVPRTRKGKETVPICEGCHRAVHAFFSNKELETRYNTVDALMADVGFAKQIRWIAHQDPKKRIKVKMRRDQRRRGRNG